MATTPTARRSRASSRAPARTLRAPLAAVYLLEKGVENRITAVPPAEAARAVLANVLFFAADAELVQAVFRAALDLVERVPVRRLTFAPDARVWDLVGAERIS